MFKAIHMAFFYSLINVCFMIPQCLADTSDKPKETVNGGKKMVQSSLEAELSTLNGAE